MDAATWITVKREFARVQEAEPEVRPSLLAALNAEVRREVESLLAALDAAPPLLGGDRGASFQPGAMVGPYRLLGELGRGGMGTVYRVERADGELSRHLALKVAGDLVFAPEAQRRFIQEREILAGLDHPNIVRLVDGGVAAGRRYFVMELAEGTPITTYVTEGQLPMAERVRLFRQVCSAIQYAHQRLILHRDIKPGNVIVLPTGQVRVLDFGIAQVVRAETLTADTRTVMHPMSFACASPEQLRGEPLALTSDIYSLGTLLYEVLTGANPQSRPDVSMEEAMRLVLHDAPARPSAVSRAVPPDLDAVTLKALAKVPADRYQSVSELDADLARWLDGRPVMAVPPRPWYVFSRWVRRHQVTAATASLAVVGIVAALGVAAAQYRRAEVARADAEARFADVRTLANGLIFRLDEAVRTKSPTEARKVIVSDALQYLDRLAASSSDPALRLELAFGYRRIADIQGGPNGANLGDREGALASARKSAAILEALEQEGIERERLLEALVATYRLLSTVAPAEQRPALGKAAVAAAERRVSVNRTDPARMALASAYFSMAVVAAGDDKRPYLEAAGREFESLLAERPDDPGRMRNVALVEKNLVELLADAPDEAERRAERAVALDSKRLARMPTDRQARLDTAISFAQLATLKKDERERLGLYERSLAIREQVATEDPSDRFARILMRRSLAQVARSRYRLGEMATARAAARRTLELFAGDTSVDITEQQWRAWGHLILAADEAGPARATRGCAHLAQAVEDFRAVAAFEPTPVPDLNRIRARLPGCAAGVDADGGAAKQARTRRTGPTPEAPVRSLVRRSTYRTACRMKSSVLPGTEPIA